LRIEAVSLQAVLEPLDFWKRATGHSIEAAYNAVIQGGSTRFLVPLLRVLHAVIRLRHRALVRQLALFLRERRPAVVVSVMPNFNAVIRDAVRQAQPGVPFVVLLTDLADFPPRFWMVPGLDRVIVGSERATEQALELGLPRERISSTSGMVLHPRFHSLPGREAPAAFRRELGIDPDADVVLLLFGGKGAAEMDPLAGALLAALEDWHVVAICGDNPSLVEAMGRRAAGSGGRLHVLGFTQEVAAALAASDLLVAKPGPGVLAEAFHMRVPAIVPSNSSTVPQERYNARFLQEHGLGIVVSHWREIPREAAALAADPGRLREIRRKLQALPENRAVFEALALIGAEAGRG
jgi:UDP-N-acetylglucosamine:LPS N-acetylglucosamine transferase